MIDIAILEKKPDQVLKWYDQRSKGRSGWLGVDEDAIADAVQAHAPDRSVAIWKNKAERLIAQVQPKAYQEAVKYLQESGKGHVHAKATGGMGSIPDELEGDTRPQTPSDRDSGWLGGKTDHQQETLTIMSSSTTNAVMRKWVPKAKKILN